VPVDPRVARSRAKLLAAATEILVEAGPRALTVDAVAERSGVAKSTLYRHWPSRTALMVDVLRENMPQVDPLDPSIGFEPCLRGVMGALADAFSDPGWCRIMPSLFALKQQFPEVGELAEADQDEKTEMLADILAAGVAEGLIPPGLDPKAVISILVGPLLMCTLSGDVDNLHAVADFTVDRFLASYRNLWRSGPAGSSAPIAAEGDLPRHDSAMPGPSATWLHNPTRAAGLGLAPSEFAGTLHPVPCIEYRTLVPCIYGHGGT